MDHPDGKAWMGAGCYDGQPPAPVEVFLAKLSAPLPLSCLGARGHKCAETPKGKQRRMAWAGMKTKHGIMY